MKYGLVYLIVMSVLTRKQPGPYRRVTPLLQWKDVHEKMPWTLYLLLGGGYAIAKAATVSPLSTQPLACLHCVHVILFYRIRKHSNIR